MKLNRCPWCGKKIERRLDLHGKQKKTPLFFRFARCHHCDHNYGQHIYSSKYMRFEFFAFLPVVIFSFIFQFYPLLLIYAASLILSCFLIPLTRMDEQEEPVAPDKVLAFQAFLTEKEHTVRAHQFYFLTENFDDHKAFSTVSPICIESFDKKSNAVSGYFLYDHPQNAEYQNKAASILYDSDGKPIGKIKFLHNEKRCD